MNDAKDAAIVALVTLPFEEQWQEQLRQLSPNLRVEQHTVQSVNEIPVTLWREVQILYTNSKILPEPEYAPKLRLVQLYSAGVDSAAKSPLFQQPAVAFSTTSGVHAANAAEYTFMMILAWCHKFTTMLQWKQSSKWPHSEERHAMFMPEVLQGKSIGIAGYGSIGRQEQKLGSHLACVCLQCNMDQIIEIMVLCFQEKVIPMARFQINTTRLIN